MADFNPNSPTLIGTEWSPNAFRTVDLGANPLAGVAQRVMPTALTPHDAQVFQRYALNSLLGCELTNLLVPTDLAVESIFPGTDTGKIAAAGWVDETGAANAFGKVAKSNDDTTYLTMTGLTGDGVGHSALKLGFQSAPNLGGAIPLIYRGNRAATYSASSQRVASVTLYARIAVQGLSTFGVPFAPTASSLTFQFGLSSFGGATKFTVVSGAIKPVADGQFRTYSVTLPGDPWLLASLNTANPFYSAPHSSKTWDDRATATSPYGFGILPMDTKGGGGGTSQFQVSGLWMGVNYCTENRAFCSYPTTLQGTGWNNLPLVGPRQRLVKFTSNSATTALSTPAGGTVGAGDLTANDVGATIVRQSDGQVVGTVQSVTNSTTAVLTGNGASTNANVLGYLGVAPAALSATTYYYEVLSQVAWTSKSNVLIDVPGDPAFKVTTSPSATGNHRTVYNLQFTNAGSFVPVSAAQTQGEMLPVILTVINNAAPIGQSCNAASLNIPVAGSSNAAQIFTGATVTAQQVTSPGTTTYAAIRVLVGRANAALDPDQPLTLEIRHGAGKETGGGSLDATATIYPSQLAGAGYKLTTVEVALSAPFAASATQYAVVFKSNAAKARPWSTPLIDDRSDLLNGAAPTAATVDVSGIASGTVLGNVDAWCFNGGQFTRYDACIALCAPPTAPSGLAATVEAAA